MDELYEFLDGKKAVIDGLIGTIRYSTYRAIYPYEHIARSLYWEPDNKQSEAYLKVKRYLGDDWSTDLLSSDPELLASIAYGLGYNPR